MSIQGTQASLFEQSPLSPDVELDKTRRALDDLFNLARKYTTTESYRELLKFVTRFRFYSPFNAMLIHTQMQGAKYVAPPDRWARQYGRRIKTGAHPLVILQPMGPVMFVFDVSDTEPIDEKSTLPREVENPFEPSHGNVSKELGLTTENAKRDGVSVIEREAGSQSAGFICTVTKRKFLKVLKKSVPKPLFLSIPLRYELVLNSKHSSAARYATITHELGHLYCGHLGTPNKNWWPDRRTLAADICEFEAESVCYLVCKRLGIDNPSDQYLSGYMKKHADTPPISLDGVMKAAGLIEKMGRERLKPRNVKQ